VPKQPHGGCDPRPADRGLDVAGSADNVWKPELAWRASAKEHVA